MVYSPQRRHASASIVLTIQALSVLQQLYTPNILVIFSRLLVQTQISVAPYVHPTRSLLALFSLVLLVNTSAICLHLLDFYAGMNGGKGIILDFVGQSYPASLRRILLLDFALFLLQTVALVVGFITNHGSNIPSSTQFPFDDLLLPPNDLDIELGEEEPLDLESGTMRRRKGKLGGDDDDENVVWLSEDYLEPASAASTSSRLLPGSSGSIRRREPPLIFSLPFPHLLHLILRLPSPQPPRSFSGGTPTDSPLPARPLELPPVNTHLSDPSPTPTTAPTTGVTANEADVENEVDDEEEDGVEGQRGSLSDRNRVRTTARRESDMGRIPGDYWVERRSGT